MAIGKLFLRRIFVIVFCLCMIGGCGSPYKSVNLDPLKLFQEKAKNATNSASPSWETRQTLRLMFLDEDYRKNHQQVITKFEQMVEKEPTPELRMAIAELSLLEAQKHKKSDPQRAIIYYVVAAQQSYDYLFSDARAVSVSPLTPSVRFMADIYNVAVADLLQMRAGKPDRWESKDVDYEGMRRRQRSF